jgi:hypothetical protein
MDSGNALPNRIAGEFRNEASAYVSRQLLQPLHKLPVPTNRRMGAAKQRILKAQHSAQRHQPLGHKNGISLLADSHAFKWIIHCVGSQYTELDLSLS